MRTRSGAAVIATATVAAICLALASAWNVLIEQHISVPVAAEGGDRECSPGGGRSPSRPAVSATSVGALG